VELRADLRDPEGVVDEVLAGTALLPFVAGGGERERVGAELGSGARLVCGDVGQQLVEKILMPTSGLDDGHGFSVLPRFRPTGPRASYQVRGARSRKES
jgi:hypothetical protein